MPTDTFPTDLPPTGQREPFAVDLPLDRAIELLEEEVRIEGEDYIYPRPKRDNGSPGLCRYVVDGKPHCLAARVLFKAGVPIEVLERSDKVGGIEHLVAGRILQLPDDTTFVLARAQRRQDNGHTWGTALYSAKALAAEIKRSL